MTKSITLPVCLAALALVCLPAYAEHPPAATVVEKLHSSLLDTMTRADELGFMGRKEILEPVLAETFDFATISRIVTASHWKTLTEEQQSDFIALFKSLSAATYASNFDGFSGEQFETLDSERKRGNYFVKSVIITGDGERVSLDYVLRESDGGWRIVNVVAQGVSDLSLKRADYTAVINSEGFDSLVSKLNDKINDYETSGR